MVEIWWDDWDKRWLHGSKYLYYFDLKGKWSAVCEILHSQWKKFQGKHLIHLSLLLRSKINLAEFRKKIIWLSVPDSTRWLFHLKSIAVLIEIIHEDTWKSRTGSPAVRKHERWICNTKWNKNENKWNIELIAKVTGPKICNLIQHSTEFLELTDFWDHLVSQYHKY